MLQKNLPPYTNSLNRQNRRYFSISAENALSSPFSCFSCILSHVSCLSSSASCLPFPVSRLSYSSLQSPVSLFSFFCLLSLLLSLVLLFPVSCLLSQVSNAVSAADLAELAILWSKLADLFNLAILTLLQDWKQINFSEHGVQRTQNLSFLYLVEINLSQRLAFFGAQLCYLAKLFIT